jgi:hypothetical protein
MSSDADAVQTDLKLRNCNERFRAVKATYDAAISENTSMSDELIKEEIK